MGSKQHHKKISKWEDSCCCYLPIKKSYINFCVMLIYSSVSLGERQRGVGVGEGGGGGD